MNDLTATLAKANGYFDRLDRLLAGARRVIESPEPDKFALKMFGDQILALDRKYFAEFGLPMIDEKTRTDIETASAQLSFEVLLSLKDKGFKHAAQQ